jgi:hypothetical protein
MGTEQSRIEELVERGKVLAAQIGANFEPGARKIRDLKRRAALSQKGER